MKPNLAKKVMTSQNPSNHHNLMHPFIRRLYNVMPAPEIKTVNVYEWIIHELFLSVPFNQV